MGMRFQKQLSGLVHRIERTSPHFIRCIKPNQKLEPGLVEDALVLNQLRYCGVVAAVELARAGYPTRYSYSDFADRYVFLLSRKGEADSGTPDRIRTQLILDLFSVSPEKYQFGEGKIFLKAGTLGRLEASRAAIVRSAICVQSRWRGAAVRVDYARKRRLVIALQAWARGATARRATIELKERTRAAACIQGWARMAATRKEFLAMGRATRVLQRSLRGRLLKRRVSECAAAYRVKRADEMASEIAREASAAAPLSPGEGRDSYPSARDAEGVCPSPASWNENEIEGHCENTCMGRQTMAPPEGLHAAATILDQTPLTGFQDELEALKKQNATLKTALKHESVLRAEYGWRLRQAEKAHGEQLQGLLEAVMAARHHLSREPSVHMETSPLVQRRNNQQRSVEESLLTDLGEEFRTKKTIFEEDLCFAQTALQGGIEGVDVDYELDDLYEKFREWKDDFKHRVLGAKGELHEIRRERKYLSSMRRGEREPAKKKGGLGRLFRSKKK